MNALKKLASQTAIYGLPTILGRLLNYLLVPLYTRVFLPEEYGIVTEMYAYVSFLFIFLTYGMETAFFRFASQGEFRNKVFGTSLTSLGITSILFLIVTFAAAPFFSVQLGYSGHPEYVKWFALILATDAISTIPYANLRLQNKPMRFAMVKIVNIVANIGFNLFFILLCPYILAHFPESGAAGMIGLFYRPETGVGYIFISNLIASILTFIMLLPEIPLKSLKADRDLLVLMLKYSWPLLIFGLAGIVNETFDRIILKHLLPDRTNAMAQLGIYGACYKVSILMSLFIQTYRYAAEPFFFDQARNKNAKATYSAMMHYFIIICLFIFLAIMLYIDVVMLFVGKSFREGVGVVPVLLMANLFLGVFYNLSVWFKLTDKTKTGAAISVAGAAITLLLNLILIPVWGYMGAAWATLICYASMMVMSYLIGQKYYPIDYDFKRALKYSLITLTIYFISVLPVAGTMWVKYFINSVMLIAFAGYVFYFEKQRFRSVVNKAF
ncbi:MAG: polysaccharide biosynthesis C-terminal domain-containing protein [Bacteroidales bacterium]|nr:polysaccharide biosynthesis C-terminal domain-containing protein [Bacteroidales bacterium]